MAIDGTEQSFRDISGVVLDVAGEPIIGASVVLLGTEFGTITDFDGKFVLMNVDSSVNSQIQISYIGYVTQNIKLVKGTDVYSVVLEEDAETLDELIVVGYGVQKKSVVTAAISKVTSDDLEKSIPTRIDNLLKGKTAGVTITGGSGQPGAGSRVRIRGTGTINNSDPIYIVDGMAVTSIDYLNPADIESIEILKDAASAAIYGTRAANGIILVTTKGGTASTKTSVSYDVSYGWQNPWKLKSVLNTPWYQTILNEAQINDGKSVMFPEIATDPGTNWQKELFNFNAPVQNHQVSLSGGTEKVTYFLSLGYLDQEGIVGGNYDRSNYNRWAVRSNNTYKVFDEDRLLLSKLMLSSNVSYSRTASTGIAENSQFYSPLGSALLINPSTKVYADDPDAVLAEHPTAIKDKDGRVYSITGSTMNEVINPIANLELPATWNYNDRITANFWGEIDIVKGLKFKSSYNVDLNIGNSEYYAYPYYQSPAGAASRNNSEVSSSLSRHFIWQLENTLTYSNTFNDAHTFTAMIGQSATKENYRNVSGTATDLPSYDPYKATLGYAIGDPTTQRASGGRSYTALASYFARVSYDYKEKYMFQATIRRDGSDKFGPNNRWATFPAFSLGWNLTREEFMAARPSWMTSIKLRGSWGKNGNQQIEQFAYLSLIEYGANYVFGKGDSETIATGVRPARLPNPDLKWEESVQVDFGIDVGLFNNALTFTADYFNKRTDGMLMVSLLPAYIGVGAPWDNVGSMNNQGFEFDLSYKFKVFNDLNINLSGNFSYLQNKLIKYGNQDGFATFDNIQGVGNISAAKDGEVYPYFYGYKTNGIFQTQEQVDAYVNKDGVKYQPKAVPGDVIFVDVDKDGQITDDDRTKIGKGTPDFTFGFTIAADWRGIDFNAFFQGVAGNDVFDATRRLDLPLANQPSWILDRWTGPGTSNKLPRVTTVDPNNNWRQSDLYLKNGAYLRLKTLQLGYTFPSKWMKAIHFQKIRLYLAGENLLTFTKYDGFDPEIASGGTSLGIDKGCYPQSRTISVGANITF